jgi:hypothetical protein
VLVRGNVDLFVLVRVLETIWVVCPPPTMGNLARKESVAVVYRAMSRVVSCSADGLGSLLVDKVTSVSEDTVARFEEWTWVHCRCLSTTQKSPIKRGKIPGLLHGGSGTDKAISRTPPPSGRGFVRPRLLCVRKRELAC